MSEESPKHTQPPRIAVVIAAAGKSTRYGETDKLLAAIQGEAVFTRCLRNMDGPGVEFIVDTNNRAVLEPLLPQDVSALWAPGGASRAASVKNALRVLRDSGALPSWIAVHDAARPHATYGLLRRCWEKLVTEKADGIIAAHPVTDTIHLVNEDGILASTPLRAGLWAAETPQLFRADILLGAYDAWSPENPTPTDDAALVHGMYPKSRILFLDSMMDNRKITYPGDLA